jgi:exopolysaccharide biosynthesis polyprenyl glycosylphosphotransferase
MRYYLLNHYLGRAVFAVIADMLCFVSAAAITWWLLSPAFPFANYALATAAGALGTFVTLYYGDAYSLNVLGSGRRTLESVVAVMGVAFVFALGVYLVVHTPPGAVEAMAHTAALYFPMLIGERLAFRYLSALPRFTDRLLVIGTSDLGVAIARVTNERRNLGTEIVGFLSDEFDFERAILEGIPVVGKVHELEKVIEDLQINHIVVASKDRAEHFPAEELLLEKLRGQKVESGVAFYERITGRVYLQDLRASYLIFGDGFRLSRFSMATKRAIDIGVSAAGLAVVAPILALCALAIRIDSKGSPIYGQKRVGKDGRIFSVIKLRSMRDGAELETGPVWTQNDDDRVTRVGRFLRMTRLDEFPQLWNVLKGDMSIVGPRPERPEFVDTLSEEYPYFRLRSALTPGLTGWAQIRHGYVNAVEGFEEKLALDLYYMKYRSTTMDLLIMWKTLRTVVLMSGV